MDYMDPRDPTAEMKWKRNKWYYHPIIGAISTQQKRVKEKKKNKQTNDDNIPKLSIYNSNYNHASTTENSGSSLLGLKLIRVGLFIHLVVILFWKVCEILWGCFRVGRSMLKQEMEVNVLEVFQKLCLTLISCDSIEIIWILCNY